MVRINEHLTGRLAEALNLPDSERELVAKSFSQPPRPEMGDLAFPCFPYAKILKTSPAAIARGLAERIKPDFLLSHLEAQGPYLNLFLHRPEANRLVLDEILTQGPDYGRQGLGRGGLIVLDYSHPNIAKPFHFGHLRSTYLGMELARIFEFLGFKVWRKNYLGDWGTQFGFIIYAWRKYGEEALLQERTIDYLVELYIQANQEAEGDPGVRAAAREYFRRLEEGDPEIVGLWERFRELSLAAFKRTYDRLDIAFDSYEGEAAVNTQVAPVVDRFLKAGVARASEGAIVVDVADVIGREIAPCMLRKSDGATTYAARDCAEAIDRWEKHRFAGNIYVVARQEDHFAQVFAALKKLAAAEGWKVDWSERCENVSFGYVKGMSTRKGQAVWLDDVLDEARDRAKTLRKHNEEVSPERLPGLNPQELEAVSEAVGQAALIYANVAAKRLSDITFDWDKVLQFEGNTGPYLQYTYARMAGIFRKARENDFALPARWEAGAEDCALLISDEEWSLVLKLRLFPQAVRRAGEQREPHEIAKYLYELATLFNHFYHRHKVLNPEDVRLTRSRLGLIKAVQIILVRGLGLLGIRTLETM